MRSCHAFAQLGHETILVAPEDTTGSRDGPSPASPTSYVKYLEWYGVSGFTLDLVTMLSAPASLQPYLRMTKMALKVRSLKPDLIYGRDVATLALVSTLSRRPIILEAHAPFTAPSPSTHAIAFRVLQRAACLRGIVTNTTTLRDHLLQSLPKTSVLAAPNAALEPKEFRPILRRSKRVQVGYAGNLYPGRGVDLIVRLARIISWADFHIIGGSEDDVDFWQPKVYDLPNIHLHGFVPPHQVDAYLAGCDILIAPYQAIVSVAGGAAGDWARWMSPVKLAQYMAHGKPIVCSNHKVLADLVVHEYNALLVPPNDIDAWRTALERLRDPDLRARIGERAYARFRERHVASARAKNILSHFFPLS